MRLLIATLLVPAAFAMEATAAEKEADMQQEKMEQQMTTEAVAMKAALEAQLMVHIENNKQEEAKQLKNRQERWANVIHKQQVALLEEEKQIQTESKELERLQREKQWQKQAKEQEAKIEADKQQMEVLKAEVEKECASMKSSVQAFIVSSGAHATCLKGQLGACTASQTHDSVVVQECKESSAGWQKKCLADRAAEMTDCAPAGADWAALRRGQKGIEADNAALKELSNYCTFSKLLAKVDESKEKTPFALILSKQAAVSKDVMAKVGEYAETFASQPWDMVKVDGNADSVIVRAENADKIRQAMLTMKAKPLDMLALAEVGVDVKDWTAGVNDGSCITKLPEFA